MTFAEAFKAAAPHMVLDRPRAESLYNSAVATAHLPGAIAELGVFRGGSLLLMSLACPSNRVYGFDTFEGLPAPNPIDLHRQGEFACRAEAVRKVMAGRNCELIIGRFPESVPADFAERFNLVHLDGDLYESTRDGLDFFWPRLVPGGRILLDDWEWRDCPGVKTAVIEFFERLGPEGDTAKAWTDARYQLTIEKRGDRVG